MNDPIFGLLRQLPDAAAREAMLLVDYLKVHTIGGLTSYSSESLLAMKVTPGTVNALDEVLRAEYHTSFSNAQQILAGDLRIEVLASYVVVNGIRVDSPQINGLPVETIARIYQHYGEGVSPGNIPAKLRAENKSTAYQTVIKYLKAAQLFPAVKPVQRNALTTPASQMSGAAPPSKYAQLTERLR